MAQRAFELPEMPSEYAIGKRYDDAINWVGVARGFGNALEAAKTAQRELGDPRVSTCPMLGLSYSERAIARRGRLVEVRS